ncbi:MAG: tryptophan--tRNA ligase [Kiritimatiellaeota bacterium]|nr:tryptophan--tRNA ligase [Kiritimatiellota bacterium]
MRVLSGIQPSGTIHLGNYFAMMKPAIETQNDAETYLFIADLHALTVLPDPGDLKSRINDVALDFLACGLDPDKTVFFRHSDIKQTMELTWILSCLTPMGFLERCHSFKDKIANGIKPNHGLFAYPVLMAADILLYKSTTVPVGKDQKQHVEVARDIALRFNNRYGDVFVLPEERIRENVAIVPGTDGRKMSKSYGNTIELFGNEKQSRKRIMSILTDSKTLEEPKDPETCPVFALYKLFASEFEVAEMAEKYRAGNYGYGHAKQALVEVFMEYFKPMRARRAELEADSGYIESVLSKGAAKAAETAEETLREVRVAIGLD